MQFLPFRSYLCHQLVTSESVQCKQPPSSSRPLPCLISPLKYSGRVSPDMFCTGNWKFHNKQVISIGGETNDGPDSKQAPLPCGEDYWQVGPIGKQWPSPGLEGQMIADRWKPPSPRRKQSGGRGGQECGGPMREGQRHGYQADESLAWYQPDSAYTSTLTDALRWADVMPLPLCVGPSCVSPQGGGGVTRNWTEWDNCRRAPPEAALPTDWTCYQRRSAARTSCWWSFTTWSLPAGVFDFHWLHSVSLWKVRHHRRLYCLWLSKSKVFWSVFIVSTTSKMISQQWI